METRSIIQEVVNSPIPPGKGKAKNLRILQKGYGKVHPYSVNNILHNRSASIQRIERYIKRNSKVLSVIAKEESVQLYLKAFHENNKFTSGGLALNAHAVLYKSAVIIEFGRDLLNDTIEVIVEGDLQEAARLINFDITDEMSNIKIPSITGEVVDIGLAIENNQAIFRGTNFIHDNDKFYLIKDYALENWTPQAAEKDLHKLRELMAARPN